MVYQALWSLVFFIVLFLTRKDHHIEKLHIAYLLKTVYGMLGKMEVVTTVLMLRSDDFKVDNVLITCIWYFVLCFTHHQATKF
jgi:hypothetical protein